jgi:hypothetical protein
MLWRCDRLLVFVLAVLKPSVTHSVLSQSSCHRTQLLFDPHWHTDWPGWTSVMAIVTCCQSSAVETVVLYKQITRLYTNRSTSTVKWWQWPVPGMICLDEKRIIIRYIEWGRNERTQNVRGHTELRKSRDSSVGIALGYGLDDRGFRVRFPAEAGKFSLHPRVQNGSGAHPASYPMDTRGSFPGVKRPGREADHSPPSSADVKNA